MDWLQKRSVPADIRKVKNPAEIVAGMMIAHKRETESAAKKVGEAEKQLNKLALQTALEVFRANRSEVKQPLAKAIGDILAVAGVTMITYDGQDLTDDMQEMMDIVEWVPGDGPKEVVGETVEPEIRRNGELLHRAKLSCIKAAQSPEDTVSEPVMEDERETESAVEVGAADQPAAETAEEAAGAAAEQTPADHPARVGWMQRVRRVFVTLFKRNKNTKPEEADPNEDQ